MATLPPLRFSVCIETMFVDMPFEQRLEHVIAQGFSAFDFWHHTGRDMNITLALKHALRLEVSAFVGSTASLVDPKQQAQFLDDIMHAAGVAVDLSCDNLIIHSGNVRSGVPRAQQRACMIENLREAALIAADAEVTLVLEPRNHIDFPGTFLTASDEGFMIIREVASPHVRLLFNVYHQQISEGNLTKRIVDNFDLIGYIRIADVPGGHEPGTGEINYEHILGLLREKGWRRYVSLAYKPLVDAEASLRMIRALSQ